MQNPLISVIVPIYKVEEYLPECLDSILEQTYENLEIILVDDGSPDNCGKICDAYALKDNRIVVIHQENGGLSAARNSGLDICNGEYICFVDSDDTIHPEFCAQLLVDLKQNQTKVSMCEYQRFATESVMSIFSAKTKVMDREQVIFESLAETKWWSAWAKLYHRSIFSELRFPVGRTNEDYAIMIKVFDQCNQISLNEKPLYNYRVRPGSIVTSTLNPHKFDQLLNAQDVLVYVQERHPNCVPPAEAILLTAGLRLLIDIENCPDKAYEKEKERIIRLIRTKFPSFLSNKYVLCRQKLFLVMAMWHPTFSLAINAVQKCIRRKL